MKSAGEKPIYIDVCAMSRPFDEQSYLRIRLETEAVNLILSKIRDGYYKLLVSPVHRKEIAAIPDMFERIELQTLLNSLGEPVRVDLSQTKSRAEVSMFRSVPRPKPEMPKII